MTYIPNALRQAVVSRANQRCEYCLLPDLVTYYSHEVDHILAEKHEGKQSQIISASVAFNVIDTKAVISLLLILQQMILSCYFILGKIVGEIIFNSMAD